MALDFSKLSPQELLAAGSAVLTIQSLMEAARTAPQGQGMFRVESALHERGFELLRTMLGFKAGGLTATKKSYTLMER